MPQLHHSIVQFLLLDRNTFHLWCIFIGLMQSDNMWSKNLPSPPSQLQLLTAVVPDRKLAAKNMRQYVWPNRFVARLVLCISLIKKGVELWNPLLQCTCHHRYLSISYNVLGDHLFRPGDKVFFRNSWVSKCGSPDSTWFEVAILDSSLDSDKQGDATLGELNQQAKQRNAQALIILGLASGVTGCAKTAAPVLPIPITQLNNEVQELTVQQCFGAQMLLSNGFLVLNPKPSISNRMSLPDQLQQTVTMGCELQFPIGSVAWLYWPDHGGWYCCTLQNITMGQVFEFLHADGDAVDLEYRQGHLFAFHTASDRGSEVPFCFEPPLKATVWTSVGIGMHCASDGWSLLQPIRLDPPPGHQVSVTMWGGGQPSRHTSRPRVGDMVLCKDCIADMIGREIFIGVVVDLTNEGMLVVRVALECKGDIAVMATRTDEAALEEACETWWTTIQVPVDKFASCWEVWGSNMDDNQRQFCRCFNNDKFPIAGETYHWDSLCEPKQLLLGFEQTIMLTSMRSAQNWKARVDQWYTEVCFSQAASQLNDLFNEFVAEIKLQFSTEIFMSQHNELLGDSLGNFTPAMLHHAFQWFSESGACYRNRSLEQHDDIPSFGQLYDNFRAVLEYSSVFPVRLQYACDTEHCALHPFSHVDNKDKIVVVDVGAGVGSHLYASRRIREHLILVENDTRDWVFLLFEIDPDALLLLQKWFATEIENGHVLLMGDMHEFSEAIIQHGIPDKVCISVECTWLAIQGTRRDDGPVEPGMALLAKPENWQAHRDVKETHKQFQSALRIVNFALKHNPHALVDFENVESMSSEVQRGIFQIFYPAARFKTCLNECHHSASHRARLRAGNYLVVAPIPFGGPTGLWQTFLGNPVVGAKVAPALKSLCITQGSQNQHFASKSLPLCGAAASCQKRDFLQGRYNWVWCPKEQKLDAMTPEQTELMLGYFSGMTAPIKSCDSRKRLLAKVFAVKSQEWLLWCSLVPLRHVESYMRAKYVNCVGVLCVVAMHGYATQHVCSFLMGSVSVAPCVCVSVCVSVVK